MVQLKTKVQPQQPPSPNLAEGMKFKAILSIKVTDTKYKNADGTTAKNITIQAIPEGSTTGIPEAFHSTAKAVVDILSTHFQTGVTDPLENCEVVEIRSKEGRNYLTLKGY